MEPAEARSRRAWMAAVAGAVAAALALGLSEIAAGSTRRIPSLIVAVGDVIVDHAPFAVVEASIGLFGTADKIALVVGTVVLSLASGAVLGRASIARWWAVPAGFTAFAALGVAAAGRQREVSLVLTATTTAFAVGLAVAAFGVLAWLTVRAAPLVAAPSTDAPAISAPSIGASRTPTGSPAVDARFARRAFLGVAGTAAAFGVIGGVVGRRLRDRLSVEGARAGVRLPPPVRADPDLAATALDVRSVTPIVTPNHRFYRIDTALVTPQVDPDTWTLRVTGRVDEPFEVSYRELLSRPMVEENVTLACVSNEVGGDLVGTARWLGVPLADVLHEAGVHDDASQVVGRSVDGFTVGFPTSTALDGRPALVAVGMNGEPLPVAHGFPARLVVSGLYGYVSATKWLEEIELTRWDDFDAYWVPRGWSKEGPVKTQSRIDTPRDGRRIDAGVVPVAGVAWAPNRGIARVEVQIGDRPWTEADLSGDPAGSPSRPASGDTWRQWVYRWDAPPGDHRIRVRATDTDGAVQPETRRPPAPDGATGWHTVRVEVT